jgi:hypothetical protein
LVEAGSPLLPDRVTPHSLRRTFASVLYALGENPAVVMAEMGHNDPGLALRSYAQAMRRDDAGTEQLQGLIEGAQLAFNGNRSESAGAGAPREDGPLNDENPAVAGSSQGAADGIRTHDLLHGKQTL